MTKSFVLLALALGLILVQTCSAGPTKLSTRGLDSDDDESDDSAGENDSESGSESESDSDDDDDKEENPALSCQLFGNQACHIECSVIAQVYNIEAKGHCDEHHTCQCNISDNLTFEDAWKNKFLPGYTYNKIINNEMVLEQAHRVFNYPLRTADEFKQLFKPILSPYQFSKLKPHDESLAAKFTKEDDSVDTAAVEKYVSEEVGKMLKSEESLLSANYKEKFIEALEKCKDSAGTLHNLAFRVRQLDNKSLETVLKGFLKKNDFEEPEIETSEKTGLSEILTNAITNEIIKQNDDKNKPAKKKAAAKKSGAKAGAAAKKPAAASAPKRAGRFQAAKKSSS